MIPVLVVVLSITVGGGLLARELYRQPDPPQQQVGNPVLAPPSNRPVTGNLPGSDVVQATQDAANHPATFPVLSVLQTYFRAINQKNYEAWSDTVTDARRSKFSSMQFHQDYESTMDGSILVYRIEPAAQNSLRVLVGFTSTQTVQAAPTGFPEKCIRWRLVLPMKVERGAYRIDATDNTSIEHDKC